MPTNVVSRTVIGLSPAELDVYRKALHNRKRVRPRASARLTRARKVVRRATLILKEQFGVTKAVLFGSVLHPTLFHSRSDVDIVVWGLTGRAYFRAVGLLQGIDPEISVDLVDFDSASPEMQEIIHREGKPL